MARDDFTWTLLNVPKLSRVTLSNGSVNHFGVANSVWYRSRRSDSIPTTPTRGGVYYIPTVYGAFRASVRITEGSVTWGRRSSLNPNSITYFRDFWLSNYGSNVPQLSPWHEMFADPSTGLPTLSSYVIATARSRVLSAAKGRDFNALQQVGELRETVNSIVQLCRLVANRREALNRLLYSLGVKSANDSRSLSEFREEVLRGGGHLSRSAGDLSRGLDALNRDAKNAARIARRERMRLPSRIAAAYLSYIYGVMPLISATYDLSEAIGYQLEDLTDTVTVEMDDPDFGIGKGRLAPHNDWTFSGTARQGILCSMTFRVQNPALYEAWRFGLLNPAAALWELTPLSFIVDWFTGIGSFLSALDTSIALQNLHNYESHFLAINLDARYRTWKPATSREFLVSGNEWKSHLVNQRAFRRMISPVPPIPVVYFRIGLNWSQVSSILAIIVATATFR